MLFPEDFASTRLNEETHTRPSGGPEGVLGFIPTSGTPYTNDEGVDSQRGGRPLPSVIGMAPQRGQRGRTCYCVAICRATELLSEIQIERRTQDPRRRWLRRPAEPAPPIEFPVDEPVGHVAVGLSRMTLQ